MSEIKKIKKSYDHVLVGYNLSSLTYAYRLHQKGESYCIIDSSYVSIQHMKTLPSLENPVYSRVPFTGVNEEQKPSTTLDDLLGKKQILEGTPLTFDKGAFKSFLGFGDTKINEIDAISGYCATQNLQFDEQPEQIWQTFANTVEEHVFLDQEVTGIDFSESEITQLTLNGKSSLSGKQFVFFSYFPFLFETIGSQAKSMASKVAKVSWWSSVSLIVHHIEEPETFELNQVYLLKGSKEQPCVGLFSRINGELISRWESFLPTELTPDSETTGTILKEIKKQIKRAFHGSSDKKSLEHILVHKSTYADFSKSSVESGKVGKFSNLQVCSPLFSGFTGWYSEALAGWELPIAQKDQENTLDSSIKVAAPSAP